MSSRGIDFSKLQPEPEEPQGPTRHLAHLTRGMSVEAFLEEAKGKYPFYGLLLPSPGESKLNQYIRTSWDSIHTMSGSACMLLTTLAPAKPTTEMRDFLTNLVGEEKANQAWKEYRYRPEKLADDVYTLAQHIHLSYDRLPCLVLMTDLNANQRLIQRIPDWDAEGLARFFAALFDKLNQHAEESSLQTRLTELTGDLGTGFMLKLQTARMARGIQDTLTHIDWSEVIHSTLTNKEFMASAFKVVLAVFGLSAG